MRLSGVLTGLTVGLFAIAPSLALAQSSSIPPEIIGRLDILGRMAGDASFCEALGYSPAASGDQAFSREIGRIAARAGVDPRDAEAAVTAAKARETRDVQAALDRVQANLKDPGHDKTLREFSDDLSVRCSNAANDPVATVLMKPPLGGVGTVSRRYVDGLLAAYGRAGWQSQYVLAGGDLAEAVGACEARLTRAQGRAYLADLRDPTRFSPDINDTIQAWFDQRVATGRTAARKAAPGAVQCRQLLARRRTALAKAPVE